MRYWGSRHSSSGAHYREHERDRKMDSLATRLENAKLASAIDDAMESLPCDSIVRIELVNGGFAVSLEVYGNVVSLPAVPESLPEAIRHATEQALGFMVG
jgi:hypothetical protein